jgi:hypothetical protein
LDCVEKLSKLEAPCEELLELLLMLEELSELETPLQELSEHLLML